MGWSVNVQFVTWDFWRKLSGRVAVRPFSVQNTPPVASKPPIGILWPKRWPAFIILFSQGTTNPPRFSAPGGLCCALRQA